MSSIQTDIREYNALSIEIKKHLEQARAFRKSRSIVEGRITAYLRSINQPGVKLPNGSIIIIKEKVRKVLKKKKEQKESAVEILKRYDVRSPERVLEEISTSKISEEVSDEKLKIEKVKAKK